MTFYDRAAKTALLSWVYWVSFIIGTTGTFEGYVVTDGTVYNRGVWGGLAGI